MTERTTFVLALAPIHGSVGFARLAWGIGFASIQLLEEAGCRVEVPQQQTCCGQPAFNSGDDTDTAYLAKN